MKQIIDGVRYDTQKAEEIASYGNGLSISDFHYIEEDLYRTKSGKWFMAGEGGALSPYATTYGNTSTSGGEIRPLTTTEAQDWLELHNEIDALEKWFADEIVDA